MQIKMTVTHIYVLQVCDFLSRHDHGDTWLKNSFQGVSSLSKFIAEHKKPGVWTDDQVICQVLEVKTLIR